MADANEFDVWQSETGYVAVTNEVRRTILEALTKKERDLNELVRLTGKAKPTLSNIHMKELLAQKLIAEVQHPTDARRKVYRLRGARIGTSNVPIAELRGAVKRYVTTSPLAHAMPLRQVVEVLLAAGPKARQAIRAQAVKLGEISAHLVMAHEPSELLPRLAAYWQREGVTRTVRIDIEKMTLEVEVNPSYLSSQARLPLIAALLAGLLEGALREQGGGFAASGQLVKPSRVRVAVV